MRLNAVDETSPADDLRRQAGLVKLLGRRVHRRVSIALLDAAVDTRHPDLERGAVEQAPEAVLSSLSHHGTFIASMLVGSGRSLGLCRHARLISLPVLDEDFARGRMDSRGVADRLATGVVQAVRLGADVVQLSVEVAPEAGSAFAPLARAIAWAARRGVFAVIAAGNRAVLAANPVLGAPGAVPVAMADALGQPDPSSPLGLVLGRNGLLAPGRGIPGAAGGDGWSSRSGSSFAAAFVTAAFAWLRGHFESLRSEALWGALLERRRLSIVPPHLDADLALDRIEGPSKETNRER